MVADARKHARMDTKIETKSISPRFGLSPMGPITSMYLIHTKINKTLRILFLKKNCENRKEKKNIQKKCKNMDEISKKTTKQGMNDTTLQWHNMAPQSSYELPSQYLLTFYFCCGIVMYEEEK